MATIDQTFSRLQKSTFRSRFHLTEKDRQYIADKGLDTIRHHAADFVRTRLAPADIPNDGKQTPMRGHPMHLLCITPVRMDALFSDFKKQGYDSRQKLDFTQK